MTCKPDFQLTNGHLSVTKMQHAHPRYHMKASCWVFFRCASSPQCAEWSPSVVSMTDTLISMYHLTCYKMIASHPIASQQHMEGAICHAGAFTKLRDVYKHTRWVHTTKLLCFLFTEALAAAQLARRAPCAGAGPPI